MRSCFLGILFLFICTSNAQTYEIGLFGGGTNNIGDVGATSFIRPSNYAVGALFKWNKSKRYAWRASVIQGKFTADDSKSNLASRQERAYVVGNSIFEASAGLEFNFVEYNLHKLGPAFTPYLYTGLTYFRYDYNYFDAGVLQEGLNQRDGTFAIPMTVGFKYRISQLFIMGVEIGARYTFTDNLDASNPRKNPQLENLAFGNIHAQGSSYGSDDWYVFSGITFTYTFGRKLCTDCFE
jgi:hypothetical protein